MKEVISKDKFSEPRKAYVAPLCEVFHLDEYNFVALGSSSVHVGDGFTGDNSISGGNYVGDVFGGEDIMTDGGGNVGSGFNGWDLEWGSW